MSAQMYCRVVHDTALIAKIATSDRCRRAETPGPLVRLLAGRILAADPALAAARPGQVLIADRQYYGAEFEAALARQRLRLLRPARKGEPERADAHLFKPLRQTIESINQTFKGQLDLERHGGHTPRTPPPGCSSGSCSASWP